MPTNQSAVTVSPSKAFQNAAGAIRFGFTNDYMFHVVLQKNKSVLKSLICSLLRLRPVDITSVEIMNPILPGGFYDSKEFILDVEIVLNGNTLLNLEMQVVNQYNWAERSLSYLCRRFDQLKQGQDYINCKPAIHIGFLDFAPFPDYPEFYATYGLLNVKNHHLYSDKFTLGVVDLSHIELATDEDRACGVDRWARLFKATTWEGLKMIAKDDPAMLEASESLYVYNADELAQMRAQARREYMIHEQAVARRAAEQEAKIAELTANYEAALARSQSLLAEKQAALARSQNLFAEKQAALAEIKRLRAVLEENKSSGAEKLL